MNIFENSLKTCEETDLTVSSTRIPPDNSRRVRISKVNPYAPSNSVQHEERPRYGHDY